MQIEMQRDVRKPSRHEVEPPGGARLGLVAGYFQFAGACGVLAIVVTTGSWTVPWFRVHVTPSNALLSLGAITFYTAGFFRTAHLLKQRRRSGAHLAAACFAAPLLGFLSGAVPSLSTLILAGTGLALTASVWRHLD